MRSPRLILIACILFFVIVWLGKAWDASATPPNPPLVQLTTFGAIDVRPAWSPDNRQIAFQSNRGGTAYHIFVMNADGSQPRQVTDGPADDRHPAWTPDGKAVVYDSVSGSQSEIWMVNLASGSRKQITHVGGEASFASVSPDGQHLSFYVYQNLALDLWTANMDGTGEKSLTQGLASANNNQCTFPCHAAAWSPDSHTIAYSAGDLDSIWTVPNTGGKPTLLIGAGSDNHFPWYTQDGKLGYITEHVSPIQSWTDAWIYDFASGKATLLQEHMSSQGPFEFSRDNMRVLFHSPRSGTFEIYMVDLTAPGGTDALHGTPVPAVPAPTAPSPAAAASPTPAATPSNDLLVPAFAATGIVIVGGVAGLAFWRRRARPNSPPKGGGDGKGH